jgi:hypothetical protein
VIRPLKHALSDGRDYPFITFWAKDPNDSTWSGYGAAPRAGIDLLGGAKVAGDSASPLVIREFVASFEGRLSAPSL